MSWKKLQEVEYIVVHCADTPASMDIGAEEIRLWHLQRGWLDIGYHFVIRRDGSVETGRPVDRPGAHARGYNHNSLGICLVGGKGGNNFTEAQMIALEALVEGLKGVHSDAEVLGHRDLPHVQKDCPQFDVRAWWESVN